MPIILVDMSLPKPSGEFEWVQESWGLALRCRPLAEIAPHVFTTRELHLDGTQSEQDESWQQLARALDVPPGSLVRMRQVHCADVYVPPEPASTSHNAPASAWPEADIAVTDSSTMALSVRTADCVPILIADRRSGSVAAVHAGWKGTAANAAAAAIHALVSRYNADPSNMVAAIGPSIGPCCYEVGEDFPARFAGQPQASGWFVTPGAGARPHLDLWKANRDQLVTAGVPEAGVFVSALCTHDHPSQFHSYRRDGAKAGRLVAAIRNARGMTP